MGHRREEVRTAYPEAGHALTAMHFIHISALGIERKVTYGGRSFTMLKGWIRFARASRVSVEENILIELAGPAAEKMCPFGPGRDFYNASMLDMEKVEKALKGIVRDAERNEYLNECRAKVERMLKHHQPEVVALAKALLEHKRLTGKQAEKIAEDAWKKEECKHPATTKGE